MTKCHDAPTSLFNLIDDVQSLHCTALHTASIFTIRPSIISTCFTSHERLHLFCVAQHHHRYHSSTTFSLSTMDHLLPAPPPPWSTTMMVAEAVPVCTSSPLPQTGRRSFACRPPSCLGETAEVAAAVAAAADIGFETQQQPQLSRHHHAAGVTPDIWNIWSRHCSTLFLED